MQNLPNNNFITHSSYFLYYHQFKCLLDVFSKHFTVREVKLNISAESSISTYINILLKSISFQPLPPWNLYMSLILFYFYQLYNRSFYTNSCSCFFQISYIKILYWYCVINLIGRAYWSKTIRNIVNLIFSTASNHVIKSHIYRGFINLICIIFHTTAHT